MLTITFNFCSLASPNLQLPSYAEDFFTPSPESLVKTHYSITASAQIQHLCYGETERAHTILALGKVISVSTYTENNSTEVLQCLNKSPILAHSIKNPTDSFSRKRGLHIAVNRVATALVSRLSRAKFVDLNEVSPKDIALFRCSNSTSSNLVYNVFLHPVVESKSIWARPPVSV